jgi:hypothetical protein
MAMRPNFRWGWRQLVAAGVALGYWRPEKTPRGPVPGGPAGRQLNLGGRRVPGARRGPRRLDGTAVWTRPWPFKGA